MHKLILAASLALAAAGAGACSSTPTETNTVLTCNDGAITGTPDQSCDRTWSCSDDAITYRLQCALGTGADAGPNWLCTCLQDGVEQKNFGANPFTCGTQDAVVTANQGCGWMIP